MPRSLWQRLISCPLSLSLELALALELALELELVVILSEAAIGACPADKRHLRYVEDAHQRSSEAIRGHQRSSEAIIIMRTRHLRVEQSTEDAPAGGHICDPSDLHSALHVAEGVERLVVELAPVKSRDVSAVDERNHLVFAAVGKLDPEGRAGTDDPDCVGMAVEQGRARQADEA